MVGWQTHRPVIRCGNRIGMDYDGRTTAASDQQRGSDNYERAPHGSSSVPVLQFDAGRPFAVPTGAASAV
jgi:hypothetical protein